MGVFLSFWGGEEGRGEERRSWREGEKVRVSRGGVVSFSSFSLLLSFSFSFSLSLSLSLSLSFPFFLIGDTSKSRGRGEESLTGERVKTGGIGGGILEEGEREVGGESQRESERGKRGRFFFFFGEEAGRRSYGEEWGEGGEESR